ncbi:MAG: hypothetical protein A2Y40_08075 [Candidatus Margulisbacteria bacterium GWF2_35_9]|nr:MAG: hypothetical protein A2Y40_08075 [Candidatus Margulisbacteria bacterium GWF2_35_9]
MFKTVIKIAYYNLWRRKSRSIVVIIMIAFGLTMMMLTQGLYEGMTDQMIADGIRTGTGQILIDVKGHQKSKLFSEYIEEPAKIESVIKNNLNVTYFVGRLKSEGMVSSAKYSQGIRVLGTSVEKESEFINYRSEILEGKFNLDNEKKHVVIGKGLAEKLKVGVGKKIVINAATLDKSIVAGAYRVAGIIRTNNPEIDSATVIMDITNMQNLFKLKNGINEYSVIVKDEKIIQKTKKELAVSLDNITKQKMEVLTWQEVYPIYVMMENVMGYFIYISYFIVFFAVAIGLFNVFLISIFERVKEYGILMAIGTPFKQVKRMIYFESFLVGFIGYLIGSVIGGAACLYFHLKGLDLSSFAKGLNDYGMAAITYSNFKASYFVLGFSMVTITTYLSAVIPVWRLKKMNPVQAIRFN